MAMEEASRSPAQRDGVTPMTGQQAPPDVAGHAAAAGGPTLDASEVARFSAIADEWWDPNGKFRPLHQIGPARLGFIRERVGSHFDRDPRRLKPYTGLDILDIGCGGGLIAEPLARLGATVLGIDPSPVNIEVAKAHAAPQALSVSYRPAQVEDVVAEGAAFDVVVCLEVVEHVPDVAAFIAACASLVRPGGIMVASTINRTLKAFALAIVGAEYVLRWLPAGTHRWDKFVTPGELEAAFAAAGLVMGRVEGLVYNPLADRWSRAANTDVNYLVTALRPSGC